MYRFSRFSIIVLLALLVMGQPALSSGKVVLFWDEGGGAPNAVLAMKLAGVSGEKIIHLKNVGASIFECDNPKSIVSRLRNAGSSAFEDFAMYTDGSSSIKKASTETWHLEKIKAPEAWRLLALESADLSATIAAVLDSGADSDHPDLAGALWTNDDEIYNGVDDDGNGYVDDVKGWNVIELNDNIEDDHGHGTQVSGLIGAVSRDSGTKGVATGLRLLEVKLSKASESGLSTTLAYMVSAVDYVISLKKKGIPVRVINFSYNTTPDLEPDKYKAMETPIRAANEQGILFVSSAGNNAADCDAKKVYPSSLIMWGLMSIAATDANDNLASFSNRGMKSIEMAAPGVEIWAPTMGGGYRFVNGTSFASPIVCAAAAISFARSPSADPSQVKQALMDAIDLVASLNGVVTAGGRLNLELTAGDIKAEDYPVVHSDDITPTPSSSGGGGSGCSAAPAQIGFMLIAVSFAIIYTMKRR